MAIPRCLNAVLNLHSEMQRKQLTAFCNDLYQAWYLCSGTAEEVLLLTKRSGCYSLSQEAGKVDSQGIRSVFPSSKIQARLTPGL